MVALLLKPLSIVFTLPQPAAVPAPGRPGAGGGAAALFMHTRFRFCRLWRVMVLPLLLGLLACSEPPPESPLQLTAVEYYQLDPREVARGEAIYEGSCARFCHEVEGDEAADLFDCEWVHGSSDAELHRIIVEGIANTRMVGFGANFPDGDNDVWRLIAFIRQNQPQCDTNTGSETQ